MNPKVTNLSDENGKLAFRISNINVSLANAVRRIILSEIPAVVFRTSPHEKNTANIIVNTSRFNNEIIKQRLSCIPIHITDTSFDIKNYIIEIDKKNTTDTIQFATTEDIKVKNIQLYSYIGLGQMLIKGEHQSSLLAGLEMQFFERGVFRLGMIFMPEVDLKYDNDDNLETVKEFGGAALELSLGIRF